MYLKKKLLCVSFNSNYLSAFVKQYLSVRVRVKDVLNDVYFNSRNNKKPVAPAYSFISERF